MVVSEEVKELSIRSLESTLHKLSRAYKSMADKGTNTTLVKKRRDAVKVGLDSLNAQLKSELFSYAVEIITSSKKTLESMIPSIEKQIIKATEGSPQKTLNTRRLMAFKLAIKSLDKYLINDPQITK